MNALALYAAPERRDWGKWSLASIIVAALHVAVIAGFLIWHTDRLPPGTTMPTILVDLSPVSAAPEDPVQDLAPGPTMQQADAPQQTVAPPPVEETIAPTPPQQNPIVAAPPEEKPKPVVTEPAKQTPVHEVKKRSEKPPAPKTSAAPRTERRAAPQNAAASGAAAAAAAASYRSMLASHLQRFKQYPSASRAAGEQGVATLSFTVSRSGQVLSSRLGRSSGHPALDAETMALIRRAQPLPAFPSDMPQASMSFNVPISYSMR